MKIKKYFKVYWCDICYVVYGELEIIKDSLYHRVLDIDNIYPNTEYSVTIDDLYSDSYRVANWDIFNTLEEGKESYIDELDIEILNLNDKVKELKTLIHNFNI